MWHFGLPDIIASFHRASHSELIRGIAAAGICRSLLLVVPLSLQSCELVMMLGASFMSRDRVSRFPRAGASAHMLEPLAIGRLRFAGSPGPAVHPRQPPITLASAWALPFTSRDCCLAHTLNISELKQQGTWPLLASHPSRSGFASLLSAQRRSGRAGCRLQWQIRQPPCRAELQSCQKGLTWKSDGVFVIMRQVEVPGKPT